MFTRSDKEYEEMMQNAIEKAGAKIAYKDKSKLLKFLNVFIRIFNKRFMTEFDTFCDKKERLTKFMFVIIFANV